MKKLTALMIALLLVMALFGCAFAEETASDTTHYDSTLAFMKQMDTEGIMYTVLGMTTDGYDQVRVNYSGENADLISINCFFTADNVTGSLCVWNVITYDPEQLNDVLAVCNTLNNDYKYVRYSCDTSDNTVTAQLDTVFLTENAGPVCTTLVSLMVASVDEAYAQLAAFNK